jgi:hypothetical protein
MAAISRAFCGRLKVVRPESQVEFVVTQGIRLGSVFSQVSSSSKPLSPSDRKAISKPPCAGAIRRRTRGPSAPDKKQGFLQIQNIRFSCAAKNFMHAAP